MLNELLKSVVVRSSAATMTGSNGPVVLTSTGDKFTLSAWAPMRLLKWGFLVDGVAIVTGGTNLVLSLDFRPTAGSDTNRVNGVDTLTITDPNSAFVLGTGGYRDPWTLATTATTPASQLGGQPGATEPIVSGQQQLQLSAGQQWVIKVGTAVTTSGQVTLFIEYVLLPLTKPSGYGFSGNIDPDFASQPGSVSLTDNLTRFAS